MAKQNLWRVVTEQFEDGPQGVETWYGYGDAGKDWPEHLPTSQGVALYGEREQAEALAAHLAAVWADQGETVAYRVEEAEADDWSGVVRQKVAEYLGRVAGDDAADFPTLSRLAEERGLDTPLEYVGNLWGEAAGPMTPREAIQMHRDLDWDEEGYHLPQLAANPGDAVLTVKDSGEVLLRLPE